MIQRIQTLYLAIAALFAFALPFFLIRYQSPDAAYKISADFTLLTTFLLVGLLAVFTIFKYSNRRTQLVLGRLNIILNFGLFVWMFVDFFLTRKTTEALYAGAGIYLPLLIVVFISLANRAIMRDERLVREADRIR
jgi:FtsH-binding integral membrane protein